MRVLAYDPFLAPSRAKAMQVEAVALDALLAQSDYITVHMPLTDDTRYLIDEAAFEKMQGHPRISTAPTGGIIKTALLAALKSGQVAAAGLDVYGQAAGQGEFRALPNVVRRISAHRPPRRRMPSASKSPSRLPMRWLAA